MAVLSQQFAKIKKDDDQDKMMEEGSSQDVNQSGKQQIKKRSKEEIEALEKSVTDGNPMGELTQEQENKIVLESMTPEDIDKLLSDFKVETENVEDVKKSEKDELNKAEFEKFKQDINKRLPR